MESEWSWQAEPAEGATVKLRSGCGADTATDVYWCSDTAIWDEHDTVYLYSAGGGYVLDSYAY